MDWLQTLLDVRGTPHVLITVIHVKGSVPRGVGTRMILDAQGVRHGTLGGGNLERLALEQAGSMLGKAGTARERYPLGARAGQCCGGLVEVLMESFVPAPRVVLFGAGHVGQALVRVLEPTRFELVVVEDREEWVTALPEGTRRYDDGWDLFVEQFDWRASDHGIIMTHNHQLDADILEAIIGVDIDYVGLIGSETKWRRTQERLRARGVTQQALDRVRCPIGIPFGGKEPGDIAISIAAQLMQEFHAP